MIKNTALINEFINRRFVRGIIFIIGVLLIASIPRLMDINHPSFSADEVLDYCDSIKYFNNVDFFKPSSSAAGYLYGHLPFIVSCFFYRLLGQSEWVARLISVVISLLAICVTFLISKRLFGYWWAIISATMLALSPFYISCSRLAFSHGHVFHGLFILLALYSLLNISFRNVSSIYLHTGLLAFLLGLALGSDFLACFWI